MIKLSIKIKVLLILLVLTTIMIITMALNMQRGFNKGFFNYKKSIERQFHNSLVLTLEQYYTEAGHWDELYHNRRLWHDLVNRSVVDADLDEPQGQHFEGVGPPMRPRGQHPSRPQREKFKNKPSAKTESHERGSRKKHERMRLLPPVSLFDQNKELIVGKDRDHNKKTHFISIKNINKTIAYLGVLEDSNQHRKEDELFISSIKIMLLQLAFFMTAVAIIITFPIAKYFTKLINQLTVATQKIAKGEYSIRIKSQRKDELGDLASNFNVLAKTLQQNSTSQKTMMADIAHELRTPISVVLGEIEAIQDGVHQANQETLGLLHSQVSSLVELVNDLRDLSESDLGSLKYHMENCDIKTIVEECFHNYALKLKQKNITIDTRFNNKSCSVIGDVQRLKQLFNNLLSNAVHYTDGGGQITIVIDCRLDNVKITIEDSAPGLDDEQLQKIFDRWYRADQSRNRKLGGSGLGLAICQKIVQAHNGHIKASPSKLGGVLMTITLPREYIK